MISLERPVAGKSASKVRALVFDVDGTLYRQRPVRLRMLARLLRSSLVQPRETLRVFRALRAYRHAQEKMRGSGASYSSLAAEQIRIAASSAGISQSSMTDYVSNWMEESPLDLLAPAMREGLIDLLKAARQRGLLLGVWSDYPAAPKLKAMGLDSFFDAVVSAQDADVQRFKPEPRGLEIVISRLRVAKDEIIYIGDRAEVDGLAAVRAGVRCVIIGSTAKPAGQIGWTVVSGFEEILRMIDSK